MKKTSKRTLLLMGLLLLLSLATFALGKYITTVPVSHRVIFSARLAADMQVVESPVTRLASGAYRLNTGATPVTGNTYVLIPGLDIDKDPRVVITDKTDIPAYLYIEIVTDTVDAYQGQSMVSYTVNQNWRPSTRPAQYGGTVYVYTGGGSTPAALTAASPAAIYILENNQITVSQHAKHVDDAENGEQDLLQIYAWLIEVTD